MLRFSTIGSLLRVFLSRRVGPIVPTAVLFGAVFASGCNEPPAPLHNWLVNVSPKTITVAPGDTFDLLLRVETTARDFEQVVLGLHEPSPSGVPFDPEIAKFIRGCPDNPALSGGAVRIDIEQDSGVASCSASVWIPENAIPGTYEFVVRGTFLRSDAIDDSNPIALIITEPEESTTGWQVVFQPPIEDISRLNDLDFPSESVGYAVGQARDGGAIAYKTSDGGENWSRLSISTTEEAQRVEFLTETTGYVGGGDASTGFLYRTTDGGASWVDVGANMPMNILVRAMSFLDPQTGYVAGSGGSNRVMFTDDGGATWKEIDWGGASSFSVSDMHFYSVDAGYISVGARVAGSGRVYYTSDAGETWTQATGGDAFKKNIGGFAVQGNNRIFVSSDSGKTWSTRTVAGVSAVNGISSGGGTNWIAGSAGGAYIAYGVGTSWAPDWQNASVHPVVDLEMFGPTKGVAIGQLFIAYRYPD